MSGWTIRVALPDQAVRIYAAAESEPTTALIRVHQTLRIHVPPARVETVEQIPARVLEELGMKAGEIKDITDRAPTGTWRAA